jgi:hypothetical protein
VDDYVVVHKSPLKKFLTFYYILHDIQLTLHLGDLIVFLISLAIAETMLMSVHLIRHAFCGTQSLLSVTD